MYNLLNLLTAQGFGIPILILLIIILLPSVIKKVKSILLTLIVIIIAFAVWLYWENEPRLVETDINLGLEKPITVAFLSDFHHNTTIPWAIDEAVRKCNNAEPDIIILGGDFKTHFDKSSLPDEFLEKLSKLKAKDIYYVWGNHDLFEDTKKASEKMNELGFKPLGNKIILLDKKLYLSGVDYETPKKEIKITSKEKIHYINYSVIKMEKLLKDIPPGSKVIFVSHMPQNFMRDFYNLNVLKNKKILFLAGHTHAGQVVLHDKDREEIAQKRFHIDTLSGLTDKEGQPVYISPGIGSGYFPLRFNAKPEVTILNIK